MVLKKNSSSNILTQSNYYDTDTDWKWQSKSIFWQFLQCEASALAQMKGEYDPFQDDTPLLFGNYLHSYFESSKAHEQFVKDNADKLYKRGNPDNGLLKKFEQAETCIKSLEDDANFPQLYQGDKEVIVTGKIDGVLWKGKIDCLDLERGIFLDLKTVDDIHKKHWYQGKYTNFAIQRGYDVQMAIYQELIKQTFGVDCDPYIVAVSKQTIPDKQIISIPQGVLDSALEDVIIKQPHIQEVIHGQVKPEPCGHCDYCRSQKHLDEIIPINDIPIY